MLTDEQLVRSSLSDVKDEINFLLLNSLNPAPRELMRQVKEVVPGYKKTLEAKADYVDQ